MKKILSTTLLLLTVSTNSQADAMGAKAGFDYWSTGDHGDAQSAYIQLEHPIPLLPNAAFQANKIDSHKLELTSYDLFGYYEVFDNRNLSLDIGFGFRRLDNGKMYSQSFSDTLPLLTGDMTLFPDSQFSFYGKINAGKSSDTTVTDASAGVRVALFAGTHLQASYRSYTLDLDGTKGVNNKETVRGPQLGLHIDI